MKIQKLAICAVIFVLCCFNSASGQIEKNIVGSIGIPQGYMDISINGALHLWYNLSFPVKPEVVITESFSTKGDGGGGRLGISTLSGLILGRYTIKTRNTRIAPFISAGAGFHYLYSFSSDDSALRGESKSFIRGKGHVFGGIDYYLTPKLFMSAWGRLTFPSDIVFDTGHVGMGITL